MYDLIVIVICVALCSLVAQPLYAADSPDQDVAKQRLKAIKKAGAVGIPDALQWLAEPGSIGIHQDAKGEWTLGEFDGLIRWLGRQLVEHPEQITKAVTVLQPYSKHPAEWVRANVCEAMAELAEGDSFILVEMGLQDESSRVAAMTCGGLRKAAERNRISADEVAQIWPWLERAVIRPIGHHEDRPGDAMLLIDRERGTKVLLNDRVLVETNPGLGSVMGALLDADVVVPRDRLLVILATIGDPDPTLKDPAKRVWNDVLLMLAKHHHADDEALMRRYAYGDQPMLAYFGSVAMLEWVGIGDPEQFVADRFRENHGDIEHHDETRWHAAFAKLSEHQQAVYAVSFVRTEISFNGVEGMLFNSSGDWLKPAVKGAHAMGATREALFFGQIANVFGEAGPSADRDQRIDALRAMPPDHLNRLKELDRHWYDVIRENDDEPELTTRLNRYAIEHKEHFMPVPQTNP